MSNFVRKVPKSCVLEPPSPPNKRTPPKRRPLLLTGYSVVRLSRLLWEQEIPSSNLGVPTLAL